MLPVNGVGQVDVSAIVLCCQQHRKVISEVITDRPNNLWEGPQQALKTVSPGVIPAEDTTQLQAPYHCHTAQFTKFTTVCVCTAAALGKGSAAETITAVASENKTSGGDGGRKEGWREEGGMEGGRRD